MSGVELPKPFANFPLKIVLPSNPHGPYFKEIDVLGLLKANKKSMKFKTSSLEEKHVWKPHFAADLGLKLDLVDQEAYLNGPEAPPVDEVDRALYSEENLHLDSKSKTKARSTDTSAQPWFFRQTTYMENNPFNRINKFAGAENATVQLAKKKQAGISNKDIFAPAFIEGSFKLVEGTVEKLKKENAGKRKLVWSKPLLPTPGSHIERSIVRFDEDPSISTGYQADGGDGETSKRFRMEKSVFINDRTVERDSTENHLFTLVAPTSSDSDESDAKLEWLKDYQKDLQALSDGFFVLIKDDREAAYFAKVSNRIDVKKIALEQSTPHDCKLTRV